MTFLVLALVIAVGLCGPLLAWPDSLRIPVVIGELLAGVVVGVTGFGWVDAHDQTLTFLADIGFAMIMFVAGSHVPIRSKALRVQAKPALLRWLLVVVLAAVLGWLVALIFETGHPALYAVLMASSSAAVILPVANSLKLSGPSMLKMLPQVAIADTACIVALPLAIDPANAGTAALGALAVIACSVIVFWLVRLSEKRGWRAAAHRKSQERGFALELRISLLILLVLAALAQQTRVSIMLAGFCLGLAVGAVGEPHRLARQLFALSEGVFGPIYFVWLGASLELRELARHPAMIVLGVVLGVAAIAVHAATALTHQQPSYAIMAAAQLGVPVAAATLGQQLGLLKPGEAAALLLGALITIAATVLAGRRAVSSVLLT